MKNKRVIRTIWNVLLVIIGNIVLAIGTGFFLVPANIVAGGLSGIAIIAHNLFHFDIDITVAVLSWSLFLVGLVFLGKKFSLQTLLGTIVYPIALSIIYRFFDDPIGLAPLGINVGLDDFHALLAGIFGGAFVGAGCAITYLGGGSTGGTDVIVFIIKKYFGFKTSVIGFVTDALIIIGGLFVTGTIPALVGVMSAFISAVMVEFIFVGWSTTFVAQIISNKEEEIKMYVQKTLNRGATVIQVNGGYTGKSYQMLQVAFDKKEYTLLRDAISRIDSKAFVTFLRAQAVIGSGFEPFPERDFNKSLGIREFWEKKKDERK